MGQQGLEAALSTFLTPKPGCKGHLVVTEAAGNNLEKVAREGRSGPLLPSTKDGITGQVVPSGIRARHPVQLEKHVS